MLIGTVDDLVNKGYGKIVDGFDFDQLFKLLGKTNKPETGIDYQPSVKAFEESSEYEDLKNRLFGGMPMQIGYCNGHNTKLNCLEYHKCSEILGGADDIVLLLGQQRDILNGIYDTSKVEAFLLPAGVVVELYATTLHYAPCSANLKQGFRSINILAEGTNLAPLEIARNNLEDKMYWAINKWLIAHPDTFEARSGAYIGLKGDNIDIADSIF